MRSPLRIAARVLLGTVIAYGAAYSFGGTRNLVSNRYDYVIADSAVMLVASVSALRLLRRNPSRSNSPNFS